MTPRATYRIQFSKEFGFDDAADLAPYLAALGISHVYASPYLKARPNSTHGYDITDHNALNPDLGDAAAFYRMVDAFRANGLKHILDFVPNHMGVGGSDNPLWLDVLEWGRESAYARWFDIDWNSRAEHLTGKVLVPFLAGHYGAELAEGKLQLKFDDGTGEFSVWAYDAHKLPVSPREYGRILPRDVLPGIGDEFAALPEQGPRAVTRASELKAQLTKLVRERPETLARVNAAVEQFRGVTGDASTWSRLDELIQRQHWRPAHFRVAADDVNYRRFFDISDLAGIRMELPEVIEHSHRFVLELLRTGVIDGLRIDHIDGLYDPKAYLRKLREAAGGDFYLVVEKILAHHEMLRSDWPVDGTTGYEFSSQLTELLTDSAAEAALTEAYRGFTGETKAFAAIVHDCKTRTMENEMAGRLLTLAAEAAQVARQSPGSADFTQNLLYRALKEIIACFPVYRTYVDDAPLDETDRKYIRWAAAQAAKNQPEMDATVFDFLEKLLTGSLVSSHPRNYDRDTVLDVARKIQQYSGPVMAKGYEDTALFRYNRFAGLNEVGSAPDLFGSSVAAFHKENLHRAQNWPRTLLTTSTHDTKHSEDARARLAAISLLPEEWATHVAAWTRILRARRGDVEGTAPPSRNDEYLFFQNLVATWPPELTASSRLQQDTVDTYGERLKKATVKSLREARVQTNWSAPNEAYEQAVVDFLGDALNLQRSEAFFANFLPFQERVALLGVHNSLVQAALKLTSPGVPDFYQGNELWDFSLVDPDNRRPVDYAARKKRLETIQEIPPEARRDALRDLWSGWRDGGIKLFVTAALLGYRRANPAVFEKGAYQALAAEGAAAEQICAFRRKNESAEVLVMVSRDARLDRASFGETRVTINGHSSGQGWKELFTGQSFACASGHIELAEVFSELPVAVLISQ